MATLFGDSTIDSMTQRNKVIPSAPFTYHCLLHTAFAWIVRKSSGWVGSERHLGRLLTKPETSDEMTWMSPFDDRNVTSLRTAMQSLSCSDAFYCTLSLHRSFLINLILVLRKKGIYFQITDVCFKDLTIYLGLKNKYIIKMKKNIKDLINKVK